MRVEYTFFSYSQGTFSRILDMLAHKKSLNKFKRTEMTQSGLSEHNGIKFKINNKKSGNIHEYAELNKIHLNNQS
jgi:hypothetical protein